MCNCNGGYKCPRHVNPIDELRRMVAWQDLELERIETKRVALLADADGMWTYRNYLVEAIAAMEAK